MKRKIAAAVTVAVLFSLGVTACSNGSSDTAKKIDGLEKLGNITVVTREEGSGTRGVFAEKVNLESMDGGSADKITPDAQIAMNADAVIDVVAKDENAIGYVSLGSITGDTQGIKVVGVDGVMPERETIADDSYPLSRNFNIAYSGKITGTGNDFLSYILSAGQEVVQENYTSVKETTNFLSDQSKGKLLITGSSSVAPLMESLAADYKENYNKKVTIEVQTSDSTSGLTAAMQGSGDWGMASRELKDYEKELLTYETIARDGVAVIVNENNPADSLTVDQLTQIFEGTDQEWKEINE